MVHKQLVKVDLILAPLSGAAPCGVDLRGQKSFSDLRQAKEREEGRDDGAFTEGKPEWGAIQNEAASLLTRQTKDLQVALWLTQALVRQQGIAGLSAGLQIMCGLEARYGAELHPRIQDEEDIGQRIGFFNTLAHPTRVLAPLRIAPLTDEIEGRVYSWLNLDQGRRLLMMSEKDRLEAIKEGWTTSEQFSAACQKTLLGTQIDLEALLEECQEALKQLQGLVSERYPEEADELRLGGLEELIRQCYDLVVRWLKEKGWEKTAGPTVNGLADTGDVGSAVDGGSAPLLPENDRDLPSALEREEQARIEAGQRELEEENRRLMEDQRRSRERDARRREEEGAQPRNVTPQAPIDSAPQAARPLAPTAETDPGWEPTCLEDVPRVVEQLAAFVRSRDPRSPWPFLLVRAIRFGELRIAGEQGAPALLEAPPSWLRRELRELQAGRKWSELLGRTEQTAALPEGRGWLDLQFYAYDALEHLGDRFEPLANLICQETLHALSVMPWLLEQELSDGTPSAGRAARQWIEALRERWNLNIKPTLERAVDE